MGPSRVTLRSCERRTKHQVCSCDSPGRGTRRNSPGATRAASICARRRRRRGPSTRAPPVGCGGTLAPCT
eukprot:76445-Chlamydomonas_euryale.AAC.1